MLMPFLGRFRAIEAERHAQAAAAQNAAPLSVALD